MSGFGVKVVQSRDTPAERSFGRALWAQALFAEKALALASANPATFTLTSSNPISLGSVYGALRHGGR